MTPLEIFCHSAIGWPGWHRDNVRFRETVCLAGTARHDASTGIRKHGSHGLWGLDIVGENLAYGETKHQNEGRSPNIPVDLPGYIVSIHLLLWENSAELWDKVIGGPR